MKQMCQENTSFRRCKETIFYRNMDKVFSIKPEQALVMCPQPLKGSIENDYMLFYFFCYQRPNLDESSLAVYPELAEWAPFCCINAIGHCVSFL